MAREKELMQTSEMCVCFKTCFFFSTILFFLFNCHSTVVTMTYCLAGCRCSCIMAQWVSKSFYQWSNSHSKYLWGLLRSCMSPGIPPLLTAQTYQLPVGRNVSKFNIKCLENTILNLAASMS